MKNNLLVCWRLWNEWDAQVFNQIEATIMQLLQEIIEE